MKRVGGVLSERVAAGGQGRFARYVRAVQGAIEQVSSERGPDAARRMVRDELKAAKNGYVTLLDELVDEGGDG